MAEAWQSGSTGKMTAEVSLTPEQLCALGLSDVTPDALAYCLQHGLRHYLLLAIDLIHQCLSSVEACHLRLEQDPETGEEWLGLDVTLQEDVEEVLANCDAYTDRWLRRFPGQSARRSSLSITCYELWSPTTSISSHRSSPRVHSGPSSTGMTKAISS